MSENYTIPNRPKPLTVIAADPIVENLDYIQEALNINKELADQVKNKVDATEKGVADGVATLDLNGKLEYSQLPDSARTRVFEVRTLNEQLSLEAFTGDICLRRDLEKTFVLQGDTASEFSNWLEIASIDSGGEIGGNPAYTNKFKEEDWILDGNGYSISYDALEHRQGRIQYLLVNVKDSNGFEVTNSYNVSNEGTVTIYSNVPFNGNIIISNLQGNSENNMYLPYTVISGAVINNEPALLNFYLNTLTLNCSPAITLVDGLNFIRNITSAGELELPSIDGEYIIFIDSANIEENHLTTLSYRKIENYLGVLDRLPNEATNGDRCYIPYQGSYERILDGWKHKAFVPIGKAIVRNTTIATVITYPYNQNGVDINYQSHGFDKLYGNQIEGFEISIKNNYITVEPGKCLIGDTIISNNNTIIKSCITYWVEGNNNGCIHQDDLNPVTKIVYEVINNDQIYYTSLEGEVDETVVPETPIYLDINLNELYKNAELDEFIYNGISTEIIIESSFWAGIYLINNGINTDAIISTSSNNFPLGYNSYRRIGYAFITIGEEVNATSMSQIDNNFYYEPFNYALQTNTYNYVTLPNNTICTIILETLGNDKYHIYSNNHLIGACNSTIQTLQLPIFNNELRIDSINEEELNLQIIAMVDERNG